MKTLFALIFLSLLLVNLSPAATLEINRNTEPDVVKYAVRACFVAGCVITKADTPIGTMPQPAAGVKPTFVMDIANKEGAVAVTAIDASLNESGLSVPLPFDQLAPAAPTGAVFK